MHTLHTIPPTTPVSLLLSNLPPTINRMAAMRIRILKMHTLVPINSTRTRTMGGEAETPMM
jgi:hypothetical protein